MAIHKSEGIILTGVNWSESSQTLTVFTPDWGKLSLTVKGSRRLNGRRGRPLTFARLEFTCYLKGEKEGGYLSEVEPVEVFLFEKDGQLGRLALASAALEFLNQLLTAGDPQPVIYQISLSFLRMTDTLEKKRLPGLFAGYILRLVSLLGFRPNLTGCAVCGRAIQPEGRDEEAPAVLVSVERGGAVCRDCRPTLAGDPAMIGLTADLYAKIRRLSEASLVEASKIPVSLGELRTIVDMITELLRFHAGSMGQLKSFDFLDKLSRAVKTYGG